MENYGQELVLDLHGCLEATLTRNSITSYFAALCKLIDMKPEACHFWDDEDSLPEEQQTNPKTCGISAVQFILTSSIVIHTLTKLRKVFVNIFSCKDFDHEKAKEFTEDWFSAQECYSTLVERK